MKYLIGIVLIGLLASCGDATGDEKTDKSVEEEVDKSANQIPVPSKLEGEWIFGHPYLRDDWEDWKDYYESNGWGWNYVSESDKKRTQVGEFLGNGKVRFKEIVSTPYKINEGKYELEGDRLKISGLGYHKNWPQLQEFNTHISRRQFIWDPERGLFIKGDWNSLVTIYKIED